MTKALHTACRVSSVSKDVASQSLWISDCLLADSYNRFTRGHRRHGSHVPGPLEARRRTTKRKNTSLAYAGTGLPVVETSVLLGQGKRHSWWKEVQEPVEHHSKSSFLPLWLLPRTTPPAPPQPTPSVSAQLIETSSFEVQARRLESMLAHVKTLEEMRNVAKGLDLDFVHEPKYSRLAFAHIIKADWSSRSVTGFLGDPCLNTPGSDNMLTLVEMFKDGVFTFSHNREPTRAESLFRGICRSITLGIVPCDQIRHLLDSLPQFVVYEDNQVSKLVGTSIVNQLYDSVLGAIHRSSVMTFEDLGEDFLQRLVLQISSHSFSPKQAKILWELRQFAPHSEDMLAADVVRKWLTYAARTSGTNPNQPSDIKRLRPVMGFLQNLPGTLLPGVLFDVTQDLVVTARNIESSSELVETWQTVLRMFDGNFIAGILDPSTWTFPTNSRGNLSSAEWLLVVSWTAVNLCSTNKQSQFLKDLRLRPRFEQLFDESNKTTRDILARVLQVLQGLPLPGKHRLLYKLRDVTGDFLTTHGSVSDLEAAATRVVQRQFSVFLDETAYWPLNYNMNDALVECAEAINRDLSNFLHTARTVIAHDKEAFRLITRICKHNLELHSTLSQSFSRREDPLDLTEKPNKTDYITPTSVTEGAPTQQLNPNDALQLMNHLATSFATTEAVSPLSAFRKVYWCYLFLHRYGAPIQPEVTRALWHVGVTRCEEHGFSKKRFQWILAKVKQVEGEAVATALLCSASFRSRRRFQMEMKATPPLKLGPRISYYVPGAALEGRKIAPTPLELK